MYRASILRRSSAARHSSPTPSLPRKEAIELHGIEVEHARLKNLGVTQPVDADSAPIRQAWRFTDNTVGTVGGEACLARGFSMTYLERRTNSSPQYLGGE